MTECNTDARDPVLVIPMSDGGHGDDWFLPQETSYIAGVVRIVDTSDRPVVPPCNTHFARALRLDSVASDELVPDQSERDSSRKTPPSDTSDHSVSVKVDPGNQLRQSDRKSFARTNTMYCTVFDTRQHVYNHAFGRFESYINMGDVKPLQRKGRIPQYSKDRLDDLQKRFDQLLTDGSSLDRKSLESRSKT